MPRQLANGIRVDLSDVNDGWDGCFALVTPASYAECIELGKTTDDGNDGATINAGIDLIKKHLLNGKVMILDDNGNPTPADITAEDVEASRAITDKLLKAITGVAPDPKGSSTAAAESSTPQSSSAMSSSNQPSSTASAEA